MGERRDPGDQGLRRFEIMGRSDRKLARTFGSGVYLRIEEEEKCLGYWGFGSGFEIGRLGQIQWGRLPKDTKTYRQMNRGVQELRFKDPVRVYCAACPQTNECWTKHRERVEKLFPIPSAEYNRRATEGKGKGIPPNKVIDAWQREFNAPPPDLMVSVGNIKDGQAIGEGKPPEDREEGTLPYPFGILVQ